MHPYRTFKSVSWRKKVAVVAVVALGLSGAGMAAAAWLSTDSGSVTGAGTAYISAQGYVFTAGAIASNLAPAGSGITGATPSVTFPLIVTCPAGSSLLNCDSVASNLTAVNTTVAMQSGLGTDGLVDISTDGNGIVAGCLASNFSISITSGLPVTVAAGAGSTKTLTATETIAATAPVACANQIWPMFTVTAP